MKKAWLVTLVKMFLHFIYPCLLSATGINQYHILDSNTELQNTDTQIFCHFQIYLAEN